MDTRGQYNEGKGPVISNPVRCMDDVKALKTLDDPDASLPFIRWGVVAQQAMPFG